jgi:hypothetical protein
MSKQNNSNERIEFYFPHSVANLLRELVPLRERSRFVVEATEKELKRKLFLDRLREFAELKKDTYKPATPRWKKVRALRQD